MENAKRLQSSGDDGGKSQSKSARGSLALVWTCLGPAGLDSRATGPGSGPTKDRDPGPSRDCLHFLNSKLIAFNHHFGEAVKEQRHKEGLLQRLLTPEEMVSAPADHTSQYS